MRCKMKNILAYVSRVNGNYYALSPEGEIKKLNQGDPVYEGDAVFSQDSGDITDSFIELGYINGESVTLADTSYFLVDSNVAGVDNTNSSAELPEYRNNDDVVLRGRQEGAGSDGEASPSDQGGVSQNSGAGLDGSGISVEIIEVMYDRGEVLESLPAAPWSPGESGQSPYLGSAAQPVQPQAPVNSAPVNNAPESTGGEVTGVEDNSYVFGTDDFNYSDSDSDTAVSVRIDSLPGTGSLTLNGTPVAAGQIISTSEIENSSLIFIPLPDENGSNYTEFLYSVNDGEEFSPFPGIMIVNIEPVDDPASFSVGSQNFTENGNAVSLGTDIHLSDIDNNITGASVTIENNMTGDMLVYSQVNGITGTYNSAAGVLVLSGTASPEAYQEALSSITFINSGDDPTVNDNAPSRTIQWVLTEDSGGTVLVETTTLDITPLTDDPVISAGNEARFMENGGAVTVDGGIILSDADDTHLSAADVVIGGFVSGDVLHFTDQNGITGSYSTGTGVLALTGTATVEQYEAALQSITFETTNTAANDRTVTWTVYDANSDLAGTGSGTDSSVIHIQPVNDAPAVSAIDNQVYAENDAPVVLDSDITVSDADDTAMSGATVTITDLHDGDILSFSEQSGITGTYNAATGVLTLTGTSTLAEYEAALESVTYASSSDDPTANDTAPTRTIEWSITDANSAGVGAQTSTQTSLLTITPLTDNPVITAGNEVTFTEGGSPVTADSGITLSDADDTHLSAADVVIGGFLSGDVLNFTDQNGITGTYNAETGVLALTGTATAEQYEAALQSITFETTNTAADDRAVTWTVYDANSDLAGTGTGTDTSTIHFQPVNDAPEIAAGTGNFTENSSSVHAASGISISDADDTKMSGATVTITNMVDGDVLSFTNQNGITGIYNAAAGVLTLTGTASAAEYEAALESITFSNSSEDPTENGTSAIRNIEWSVTDADSLGLGAQTTTINSSINVTPLTDNPTLGVTDAAASYTENGAGVNVITGSAITDTDDTQMSGAVIAVSDGFTAGDVLAATNTGSITSSYNAATGVLTLTGADSIANYNTVLQSIKFSSTSDDPSVSGGTREISYTVTDANSDLAGTGTSNTVISTIVSITPQPDAPVLADIDDQIYREADPPIVLDSDISLADVDDTHISGAAIKITDPIAGDELGFTNQNGITGTWNAATYTLTLTGTATVEQYEAALESVTYVSSSSDPTVSNSNMTRDITWTVTDANSDGTGAQTTTDTSLLTIVPIEYIVNPEIITTNIAYYTENDEGVVIAPDMALTYDAAGLLAGSQHIIESFTVSITTGFKTGDQLLFTDQSGITGSYNAAAGVLTLTGNATVGEYEAALQTIKYYSSSEDPEDTDRVITWDANVAGGFTGTNDVVVTEVNDLPVPENVIVYGEKDDTYITVTLTSTDVDSVVTHYQITGLPVNGTLYLDSALTAPVVINTEYAAAGEQLILYFKPDYNAADGTIPEAYGNDKYTSGNPTFTFMANNDEPDTLYSTTPGTATIVVDDLPYAHSAADVFLTEKTNGGTDTSVNGNLLTDGTDHSDGVDYVPSNGAQIYQVQYSDNNGSPQTATLNMTATTLDTYYGKLVINMVTGEYTFISDTNLNHTTDPIVETFKYNLKDGDGDVSNWATQNINILDGADPAFGTPDDSGVYESHLPFGTAPDSNETTQSGSLHLTAGSDNYDVKFDASTITALQALNLQSDSNNLSYVISPDGHTLTAARAGDSAVIFTVTVTNPTGDAGYDFNLQKPIDKNADETLTFNVAVEDLDGDTDSASFDVVIYDDAAPTQQNITLNEDVATKINTNADATQTNTTVTAAAAHGTAAVDADGRIDYTPDADFSGTDTFTYETTTDQGTVTTTVNLTVNPAADGVNITANAVSGNEDTEIPFQVVATIIDNNTATDGSTENLETITISGVPDGATVYDSGHNVVTVTGGSFTINWNQHADYTGNFTVLPPQDSNTNFNLTVTTVTSESGNGSSKTNTATLPVSVAGVVDTTLGDHDTADTGRLFTSFDGNNGTGVSNAGTPVVIYHTDEDVKVDLNLTFDSYENINNGTSDGSEVTTVVITNTATGDASNFRIVDASGNTMGHSSFDGWHLTEAQAEQAHFLPAQDWGEDITLQVTTTVKDMEGGTVEDTNTQVDYIKVEITPVTDVPDIIVRDVFTSEDNAVSMDIRPIITDIDGSESAISVSVENIPAGSSFQVGGQTVFVNNGTSDATYTFVIDTSTETGGNANDGDTSGTITLADLGTLTFTPPPHFNGSIDLLVTPVAQENSGEPAASQPVTVTVYSQGVADVPNIHVHDSADNQIIFDSTPMGDGSSAVFDGAESHTITIVGTERTEGNMITGIPFGLYASSSEYTTVIQTSVTPDYSAVADPAADISETISYIIDNVPNDIRLVDTSGNIVGTYMGDGSASGKQWALTADEINGLLFQAPEKYSGVFDMTLITIVTENDGNKTSVETDFTLDINPYISTDAGDVIGTASGDEDGRIYLSFNNSDDVSEDISYIHIPQSGIPAGFTLMTSADGLTWNIAALTPDGGGDYYDVTAFYAANHVALQVNSGEAWAQYDGSAGSITGIEIGINDTTDGGSSPTNAIITGDMAIEINAVADAPVITADSYALTPDCNTAAPLNIHTAYADVDGSEAHYYIIQNVPNGWYLNNAEYNGDGTWYVSASDIENVSVVAFGDAAHDITIVGYSVEGSNSDTATSSITINVDPNDLGCSDGGTLKVAQMPTLITAPFNTLEDTASLTFANLITDAHLNDSDGGTENLALIIKDLPAGFEITSGSHDIVHYTDNSGDPCIRIMIATDANGYPLAGELEDITVSLLPDFSGDFIFTLNAVAIETGNGARIVSTGTNFTYNAEADVAPAADNITASSLTGSIAEDTPAALKFTVASSDSYTDASDSAETVSSVNISVTDGSFVVNGVEYTSLTGVSIDGGGNVTHGGQTVYLISKNQSTDSITVTVTAVTSDSTAGYTTDTDTSSDSFTVTVNSSPDPAGYTDGSGDTSTLHVDDVATAEDTKVLLNITAIFPDTADGSEIHSLKLTGIPDGALVVDVNGNQIGQNNGDGTWKISEADISAGVFFIPSPNYSGTLTLGLTAFAIEKDTFDSAEYSTNFDVTVTAAADGVVITTHNASGAEGEFIHPAETFLEGALIETENYLESPYYDSGSPDASRMDELYKVVFTGVDENMRFFYEDANGEHVCANDIDGTGNDTYTIEGLTQEQLDSLSFHSTTTGTINLDVEVYSQDVDADGNIVDTSATPETGSVQIIVSAAAQGAEVTEFTGGTISLGLLDGDGSESITSATIGGIPADSSHSWTYAPADNEVVTVNATVTEGGNPTPQTITINYHTSGDDSFSYSSGQYYDGGTGNDTITVTDTSINLELYTAPVRSVETINLSGSTGSSIHNLSVNDFLTMQVESDTLTINGDSNDAVTLSNGDGGNWSLDSTGGGYDTYSDGNGHEIKIDIDITTVIG
jgi:hypothetical protein